MAVLEVRVCLLPIVQSTACGVSAAERADDGFHAEVTEARAPIGSPLSTEQYECTATMTIKLAVHAVSADGALNDWRHSKRQCAHTKRTEIISKVPKHTNR